MLRKKYYKEIMGNEYVKELESEIIKKKDNKFMREINNILNSTNNGINVIRDINEILKNKYNEKKDILIKRIRILLQNRNFKRITIGIISVAIFLSFGVTALAAIDVVNLASVAFSHTTSSTVLGSEINTFAQSLPPYIKAVENAVPAFGGAELAPVQRFISVVINTIRGLAVSVCGLMAANSGLKMLTEENADGAREAKKTFQKILWGLFMVFAGTALAAYLGSKLL